MMPWPDYSEAQLKQAHVNVKFGAWFMERILDGANGSVMASLAGYGGRPTGCYGWSRPAATRICL